MKISVCLLILCTFILNSCYVYRPEEIKKGEKPLTIQEQLKPNNIYKIDVNNKTYLVKALKWDKDSLSAQINLKKDIRKNFAANQITNVREHKFSDSRSNFLTVISYIAVGVGVYLLVK